MHGGVYGIQKSSCQKASCGELEMGKKSKYGVTVVSFTEPTACSIPGEDFGQKCESL
jgi:hypothetical protein